MKFVLLLSSRNEAIRCVVWFPVGHRSDDNLMEIDSFPIERGQEINSGSWRPGELRRSLLAITHEEGGTLFFFKKSLVVPCEWDGLERACDRCFDYKSKQTFFFQKKRKHSLFSLVFFSAFGGVVWENWKDLLHLATSLCVYVTLVGLQLLPTEVFSVRRKGRQIIEKERKGENDPYVCN